MSGIVIELQRDALDKSIHTSDLLRKALLVARKLKITEIESWLQLELNGYTDANIESFPAYRWITGEIKSFNPYNGMWLPIMFPESESEIHRALTRRPCNQAIAEIENLVTKGGKLSMPYSTDVQAKLIKAAGLLSPPVLIIPESKLHGIVDAVRTAILDWALKLEEGGITGENMSFSEEDRKTASHITFNIGSMSNSQIQADTSHSQQVLANISFDPKAILDFVAKTRISLSNLQLEKTKNEELASELDTLEAQAKSPIPKDSILRESMKSVRTILEGVAGRLAAEGLIIAIKSMSF